MAYCPLSDRCRCAQRMRYVAVADVGRACERTTAVGWLVTRRCPPSIGATRAPVIATAPGSGGRDLKRWAVAASLGDSLELGHLRADDVPRAVLKPSGKASAPCLHRSRGRRRRPAPTDRGLGRHIVRSIGRVALEFTQGPAAEISPRGPGGVLGNPGPVGDLPRRSVERTGVYVSRAVLHLSFCCSFFTSLFPPVPFPFSFYCVVYRLFVLTSRLDITTSITAPHTST